MRVEDRDYFMFRAREERDAARHSVGPAHDRHEELAALYEMRVLYFDRGFAGEGEPEQAPVPLIVIAA